MTVPDAWRTLGLEPGATPEEIARAYRARAAETHPDVGGSREEWDELAQAYAMLAGGGLQARSAPGSVPGQEQASTRRRRLRVPWWVRLVAVSAVAWAAIAVVGVYLWQVPSVPWQVPLGVLTYLAGWWLWWLLREFRRPSLGTMRWYLTRVPEDRAERERLAQAMGGTPPIAGEGETSRRAGSL